MAEGVLVLGAGGFIGGALVSRLAAQGAHVIAAASQVAANGGIERRATGRLSAASDWSAILAGAKSVVHLAMRAHAPPGDASWIASEVATAEALARAAKHVGVGRIVLLSSIKALGEPNGERPFRAADAVRPADPYGRAKAAIEAAMAEHGPPLVILRPPLVYGPGVKANFRALIGLVARGLPLPLASVTNRRAMIFRDNLLDLIELALDHPRAPGGTFLMRDEHEPSTPELVRLIAQGLGRSARLLPCPPALLRAMAGVVGRDEDADRLLGSLSVDDAATRQALGWRPRVAIEDGVAETCRSYPGRGRDGG